MTTKAQASGGAATTTTPGRAAALALIAVAGTAIALPAMARQDGAAGGAEALEGAAPVTPQRPQPQQPGVNPTRPGVAGGIQGRGGVVLPPGSAPGAGQVQTPSPRGATGRVLDPTELDEDDIVLSDFAQAVDLRTLVQLVAEALEINIVGNEGLQGSIVFNAPVVVKREDLLDLLDSLLETVGFTITADGLTGWYKIVPIGEVPFELRGIGGEMVTTRLVPTPGIRPSSLQSTIDSQLGVANRTTRISYVDDLGVIIVTDSPRRIDSMVMLVRTVLDRASRQDFIRFELQHLAANVARTRVLELLGLAGTQGPFAAPGQPAAAVPGAVGGAATAGTLSNLADRLVVDNAGNALILRGFPEEADQVRRLLSVLDLPNTLQYRQYFAGTSATQIAQLAERRGLGTVEVIDTTGGAAQTPTQQPAFPGQPVAGGGRGAQAQLQAQFQAQQTAGASIGGSVMVVDAGKGTIIYYGTPAQQEQLASLIKAFDTEQDLVVIREYPIRNRNANDIADVLIGLVSGSTGTDTSNPFLSPFQAQFGRAFGIGATAQPQTTTRQGQTGRTTGGTRQQGATQGAAGTRQQQGTGIGRTGGGRGLPGGDGGTAFLGSEEVFIIADQGKNQVLVRAPVKQQEEFARLIERLDKRRPQVFLEVQIVSVSADDSLRVAIENQLINAGGTGGALNTNFGLGSLGQQVGTNPPIGNFVSPKNVATGLSGLTAAIIKNDQVPIVINAIKRNSQTRILSSPQLLVDDNEEASIISVDQQPTATTSQTTGNPLQTSFGGYENAGTELTVTPSISEGGYLRLSYAITLSNFVGTGSNNLPPPRQERTVESNSVTLPGDSTIVVGGIRVDADSTTKARIPLLGEIPLIGWLFGDTTKSNVSSRLYIFITPRILRDENFRDLLLLTRGPQADAGVDPDVPLLRPEKVRLIGAAPGSDPGGWSDRWRDLPPPPATPAPQTVPQSPQQPPPQPPAPPPPMFPAPQIQSPPPAQPAPQAQPAPPPPRRALDTPGGVRRDGPNPD